MKNRLNTVLYDTILNISLILYYYIIILFIYIYKFCVIRYCVLIIYKCKKNIIFIPINIVFYFIKHNKIIFEIFFFVI